MTAISSNVRESSRQQPEFFSNFCTAARIRGRFSAAQWEHALDRLRPRHVLLVPDASRFPLRILEERGDEAWKEVVRQELLTPFPGGREHGPFARFTLLQSGDQSDLVGTFHHGVCDGLSGAYVLRDLLRLLGDPSDPLPPLPAPPDLAAHIPESAARNPRLLRRLGWILLDTRLRMALNRLLRPRAAAGPAAETPLPHLQMHILTRTLSDAQTASVMRGCKAAGVTVHAAVCTAWLLAYAETLPGPGSRMRSVSSPVSLRGRLTQPVPETAGLYLSTVDTRLRIRPGSDFREAAGEFQARFKRDTADGNVFLMPLTIGALFRTFSKAELGEAARIFFGRPVRYDFSVTNLGRLGFPSRIGSLQVESVYNLVNSSEHERTVNVNTFDGRLTMTLMFRESKMTTIEGERLMERAVRLLTEEAN